MPADYLQQEGTFKLGPVGGALVNYSADATAAVVTVSRASVTTPPTFALAETSTSAGARERALQVSFLAKLASSTSLWAALADAVETDTSELDFEVIFSTAGVSSTNKRHKGTIIVMSMETGGTVGENRTLSMTFPIKRGTYVAATI